jgi:hypothetical protein
MRSSTVFGKRQIRWGVCIALAIAITGCGVLDYTPLRDNPNDPEATVVAAPVFDPPGGVYDTERTVAISSPRDRATIRYTVDGTTPTSSVGSLYVGPVAISGTSTLKAIAYMEGLTASPVTEATYTIQSGKSLTSFGLVSPAVSGTIDEGSHTVALTVPFGTAVTSLVANFVTTGSQVMVGSTVQVSGTTANDFTSPVTYTVVAADWTTQVYVVTVTLSSSTGKALTSFWFQSPAVTGVITESTHAVAVAVPHGTSVIALVASFATNSSQVRIGTTVQVSGTTANDFTSPVIYTIVAADTSTQDYVVTVTAAPAARTVTYNANGATSGTVPVDGTAYLAGQIVTVLGNTGTLARTGWTFGGWNTAASGSGTTYAPSSTFVMGSADVTLYAFWISDGSTWTQRTMPSSQTWQNLFYGNGIFLAQYGSNVLATSPDAVTWTEHTVSDPPPWGWIAYGNGVYVTVSGSGVSSTSPDGLTWTQHTMTAGYGGVRFLNGVFVVRSATKAATSPDGITWTEGNMPSEQTWAAIAYGNGTFVAVTNDGNSVAATSPDGLTWTQGKLPGTTWWKTVTFGNGVFVALADGTDIAATSPDGITWSTQSLGIGNYWYSVTYGGGTFVAVGLYNGVAVTSPDGAIWTQRALPTTNQWCTVAYGNGIFVASNWDTTDFVATSP